MNTNLIESTTAYSGSQASDARSDSRTQWLKPQTIIKKAGALAVCGALVFASCPVTAFAAEASSGSGSASGSGSTSGQSQPPAKPDGDTNGSAPSDMGTPPDGEGGGSMGTPPDGNGGGMGGANTMTFDYSGTYSGTITADAEEVTGTGETYEATTSDQNAALAQNGGTLTLTDVILEKSGDDTNGDNCNFYGVNSILLSVGEGSLATISNSQLSATSEGSNAIFATDGATVYAWDDTISTTAGNSRGLDATYDGTIIAANMDITTQGDHCASIATDRGGGNISVTDSELETNGSGSPLLYSTGDIEVNNVTGTSSASQIAGMEGLNTILINNSDLESTNTGTSGSDPVANGVIIYQSTSGDAESTTGDTATFQAANSTLTSAIASGSMFYLTNTSADIVLSNTTLNFDSSACDLLMAAGNDANSWGAAGSNGATVKFTAIGETLAGNIEADTISSVDAYLTDSTTWTGAASIIENSAGSTSESPISVSVDSTSTWVVTADSTISNLTVAEGTKIVDEGGKTVTIVAGGETVVQGDSTITLTVAGTYSTDYDESSASTLTSDVIDRTAFDEASGLTTTWAMGEGATTRASAATAAAATTSSSTDNADEPTGLAAVWQSIVSFFQGLFGAEE